MDGFILLERAAAQEKEGGECGLLIEAVYPVLGKADPAAFFPPPSRAVELDTLVVREEGFRSSAIATDCGGGTSEMVFNDSKYCRMVGARKGRDLRVEVGVELLSPCSERCMMVSVRRQPA